uniref:Uncharacterized protein n=1 Tax=Arundo donax TaxID=35708 RepID=A0A0A9G8U7_ARUDO
MPFFSVAFMRSELILLSIFVMTSAVCSIIPVLFPTGKF